MKQGLEDTKSKVADAYQNTKEKVEHKMDERMDKDMYDPNNPKIEVEDTKKIVIK
jgi:hypothetical protein